MCPEVGGHERRSSATAWAAMAASKSPLRRQHEPAWRLLRHAVMESFVTVNQNVSAVMARIPMQLWLSLDDDYLRAAADSV